MSKNRQLFLNIPTDSLFSFAEFVSLKEVLGKDLEQGSSGNSGCVISSCLMSCPHSQKSPILGLYPTQKTSRKDILKSLNTAEVPKRIGTNLGFFNGSCNSRLSLKGWNTRFRSSGVTSWREGGFHCSHNSHNFPVKFKSIYSSLQTLLCFLFQAQADTAKMKQSKNWRSQKDHFVFGWIWPWGCCPFPLQLP